MPTEMEDVEQVIDVDTSGNRAALKDAAREPGSKKSDPILVADNVRRTFGGLTAVDVKHVEIQRGVITGLIGPNGAGKTTFFNLLTGFDQPDEGQWTFKGIDLKGKIADGAEKKLVQAMYANGKMTVNIRRLGAGEQPSKTQVDVPMLQTVGTTYPAAAQAAVRAMEDLWKTRSAIDFSQRGKLTADVVPLGPPPNWPCTSPPPSGCSTARMAARPSCGSWPTTLQRSCGCPT